MWFVAAECGIQRLVLVRGLELVRGGLLLSWAAGLHLFVGRGDGGVGERGEVAAAVAKLILDGEGRKATDAAAIALLELESLGQESSLESESVEGRQSGGHLAGARAGQVVQRETGHAGVGGRLEGAGAQVEAARTFLTVYHCGIGIGIGGVRLGSLGGVFHEAGGERVGASDDVVMRGW